MEESFDVLYGAHPILSIAVVIPDFLLPAEGLFFANFRLAKAFASGKCQVRLRFFYNKYGLFLPSSSLPQPLCLSRSLLVLPAPSLSDPSAEIPDYSTSGSEERSPFRNTMVRIHSHHGWNTRWISKILPLVFQIFFHAVSSLSEILLCSADNRPAVIS